MPGEACANAVRGLPFAATKPHRGALAVASEPAPNVRFPRTAGSNSCQSPSHPDMANQKMGKNLMNCVNWHWRGTVRHEGYSVDGVLIFVGRGLPFARLPDTAPYRRCAPQQP